MRRFILWSVLLFPILELWVIIQVGREIGALATIGLLILSVAIGLTLLRLRGFHLLSAMREELAAGRSPSGQIADAICLMLAGWLFLFPGFVSDILALLCLVPGMRHLFFAAFAKMGGFRSQTVHFSSSGGGSGVTWTCVTHGQDSPPTNQAGQERDAGLVIDCDAQPAPRSGTKAPLPSGQTPPDTPR